MMKNKNTQELNVFRIIFQTGPLLAVIAIIIGVKGYDLYFAEIHTSLGIVGSFFFAIFVCLAIQLIVSKNEMLTNTKIGILSETLLIIESLLLLLFAQYHLLLSVLFIIGIGVFSLWLNRKILNINSNKRKVTKKMKKWCRNRSNSLVAYLLCFVLIIPAGIGVYDEYYKYSLSAEDWNAFISWFNSSNEESEEVQEKAFPHEDKIVGLLEWESLDVDEKERTIRAVAMIEKEELGIGDEVEITVSTEKMPDGYCGYYLDTINEIFINYKYLNEENAEEVLDTILHEMHHAFVYYTIETIDYDSEIVQNSFYYKQARDWKENAEHYISSGVSFEEYKTQPIEADARKYAEERVQYYMDYINAKTVG